MNGGRYRAYPAYKDSGVRWLGEVPSEWIVSKFRYVKTILTDYTANGSFADLKSNVVYRDVPSYARLVRLTDLRAELNNDDGVWIDEEAYKYLRKSALYGGEFLMANVGAYAGLFYQMPFDKGNASLAPNMFMAKFDERIIHREFMAYVGQSNSANQQLRLYATASSAQPKLNKDDFKSVRFARPSIIDQIKIVNFLDHETAKIDTLIEKQQQLIALLKEKRQAVISHAVTKGLNPDAPMKDSGVEWLGRVPADWDILPIKRVITNIDQGSSPSISEFSSGNHDSSVIKISAIKQGKFYVNETKPIDDNLYEERYQISKNDLLVTRGNTPDLVADACVVDSELDARIMMSDLVYRLVCSDLVIERYLCFWLLSHFGRLQIKSDARGSSMTMAKVSQSHIKSWLMTLPPVSKQSEIVEYLTQKDWVFEESVNKLEAALKLLQERRTALISAAVTGKIDVRNWQPPTDNTISKDAP